MGGLRLQKFSSRSALIHVILSQSASFSERPGDILMCTGICNQFCYLVNCLDLRFPEKDLTHVKLHLQIRNISLIGELASQMILLLLWLLKVYQCLRKYSLL